MPPTRLWRCRTAAGHLTASISSGFDGSFVWRQPHKIAQMHVLARFPGSPTVFESRCDDREVAEVKLLRELNTVSLTLLW